MKILRKIILTVLLVLLEISFNQKSQKTKITEKQDEVVILKNDSLQSKFDSSWIGKYSLELPNKDELITSFLITINPESIDVEYAPDGDEKQIYKNVENEFLSPYLIEIRFNKEYENMGIVRLEKGGNSYTLSGYPVAIINPGTDDFDMEKIE